MAAYEDSYKSQLQGVSQQVARDRLDGQVTAQDNMLSDTVTNLRRRPGARLVFEMPVESGSGAQIGAWEAQIKDRTVLLILNGRTGVVYVLEDYVFKNSVQSPYLLTGDIRSIQTTALDGEFLILNRGQRPLLLPHTPLPQEGWHQGFYYVKSGAFSKEYSVTVSTNHGAATYTYTTPDATVAGAAAASTPEAIALNLANQINAGVATHGVHANAEGNNIGLYSDYDGLVTSTPSGASYLIASNYMALRDEADLPTKLPAMADGWLVRVGAEKAARYYKWNAAQNAWLESGNEFSPAGISNMPVRIGYDSGMYTLSSEPYEGRLAGDDTTNPHPDFVTNGITGMATYQGRLVLLAGPTVCMSAAGEPRRFYRSTVVDLLDNDPIGVGSSGSAAASWRYAVPYQKDLLLFSADEQGLVPGANSALTPRTAVVLPSTKYTSDPGTCPLVAGRTVLYPTPRSADYFGVLELSPSTITEGQYVSDDATPHIPKYMPGRSRFSVSSSVANMAVFGSTGDLRAVTVHEYFWNEDKKVQQAWHRWTFPYDVKAALFHGNSLVFLFLENDKLVGCAIDPRAAGYDSADQRRPFLDFYAFAPVANRLVQYPTWMFEFDPSLADVGRLKVAIATGGNAGEEIGYFSGKTDASYTDGTVALGIPFRSSVSPTQVMRKDDKGVKISSNKLTVQRFSVGTNNSSAYNIIVRDKNSVDPESMLYSTLYFSSPELEIGEALEGGDSTAVVPARMLAESLVLELWTEGLGEMNLVGLEYVAKYHEKIKRNRSN